MTVYLLHFETPLHHAQHYIGYAEHVERRLEHHRNGTGARLLQVCNERGITYTLARTWEGEGKDFERKLKRCKHAAPQPSHPGLAQSSQVLTAGA
jgi:predicted GIY-YIG superfamily endonuclease